MYIAPGQGLTIPWWRNSDVNRNILSLRLFVASFNKSLWSLILYNFLHDFIHVYSPGADTPLPRGQSGAVNRNVLSFHSFVESFKQMSLKSDFIHFFFIINFIHVYSPGQGQTAHRGKIYCQQKGLITYPFVANFKISLWSQILYICFMFSWFNTRI